MHNENISNGASSLGSLAKDVHQKDGWISWSRARVRGGRRPLPTNATGVIGDPYFQQ